MDTDLSARSNADYPYLSSVEIASELRYLHLSSFIIYKYGFN